LIQDPGSGVWNEEDEVANESEPFLQRVLAYIDTTEFRAVSAHELAPGIIVVPDTTGEVDVYFDRALWQFMNPSLWARAPKASEDIGLLPGIGMHPAVKSPEEALEFAQRNLRRTGLNATVWPANITPIPLPDGKS
jgi:hypothetical protein